MQLRIFKCLHRSSSFDQFKVKSNREMMLLSWVHFVGLSPFVVISICRQKFNVCSKTGMLSKGDDVDDIIPHISISLMRNKNINLLIAKIKSLNDNPTLDYVLKSPSLFPIPVEDSDSFFEKSDTSLSYLDKSLPEFETFSDHTKETNSSSTIAHADNSFSEYDSFVFETKPDQGELTSVVMEDILGEPHVHVPNLLPTHPTVMLDSDFIPSDDSLGSDLELKYGGSSQARDSVIKNKHFMGDNWYKARLVANGRSQRQDIDCDETFSPVVKPTTIRIVLSLAVTRDWPIHQLDVKNAFFHGQLSETIYMHRPPGFVDSTNPDYVCHLQRSMYGIKQAPRAWFQRFASFITRVGFQHSKTDASLFVYHRGSDIAYLLLYVDDIVLIASDQSLDYFCLDLNLHSKFLSGLTYSIVTLARPLWTLSPSLVLMKTLSICLYMHDPRDLHFTALKRILFYVCGTLDHGLQLHVSFASQLTTFTDADWVGCPVTRRSTFGTEAEYRGVANVVAETAWIQNLLLELHAPLTTATLVYCDNVSVEYLSTNPVQHQRTKHIEIDIHFV
nr:ribonuclease H-like domain-containing protein [Tanacetum cinerariifolium]